MARIPGPALTMAPGQKNQQTSGAAEARRAEKMPVKIARSPGPALTMAPGQTNQQTSGAAEARRAEKMPPDATPSQDLKVRPSGGPYRALSRSHASLVQH